MAKRICCVGAGYVGGTTMPTIAKYCPEIAVTVVDIDETRIAEWNSGELPIYEPGLQEIVTKYLGKNLFFTSKEMAKTIKEADIIFIAVNTGTKEYGLGAGCAYDMTAWESVARSIAKYATEPRMYVIVEKSTVPVCTADKVRSILASSKAEGTSFEILSNPEFLAEGTAVADLDKPDRVLIGGLETEEGERAVQMLVDVYAHWVPRSKILTANLWSAELAKLAANTLLAQRVSSVNALSAVCEATGAKIDQVTRALGTDSRIGPKFLKASVGWGGSCFKKDINGLVYLCEALSLREEAAYFRMVISMNEHQKTRFCERMIKNMFGTLRRKKIAVLGFAFKKDTGDIRESPAIDVCRMLLAEGANLHIYDPKVRHKEIHELFPKVTCESDPYAAMKDAHAIVVMTEWDEFKTYNYKKVYEAMLKPAFVFDGRNVLDHDKLNDLGFRVFAIGARSAHEDMKVPELTSRRNFRRSDVTEEEELRMLKVHQRNEDLDAIETASSRV